MDQCKAPACARRVAVKSGPNAGWCGGHVQQFRSGRPIAPLRPRAAHRASEVRDALGRKRCVTCGGWHPVAEFSVSRRATDGLHSYCRACMRNRKYVDRYGVTVAQVDEMYADQNGACAGCGQPEGVTGRLVVDHDHSHCENGCPECVRGLLCRACNIVLGLVDDQPERLDAVAAYLRRCVT